MSQNHEKVEFIFTDRAIDQALSNLDVLGFYEHDPILMDDMLAKEYVSYGLEYFKPIPWLIRIATITEKGRARLKAVEKEDLLRPEIERLTKHNPYIFDDNDKIYMGFLFFTAQKIQEEIEEGRHVHVARVSMSNVSLMNYGDALSKIFPEYFGPYSEWEFA